ncbi:Na+/H+ antiporter NhaC family protein [Brevibacillus sp. NRS-1366]|uniref:Na+/H+ antiporter NhaC family protein n=1 Tax=Brevibacillus sp. NRS-1366 TaxID=3233899 RepID=UPI003D2411A4
MSGPKVGNSMALLPLLLFLVLFIGTGILTKDISNMPLVVAAMIAAFAALLMNRKESFVKKVDIFCVGAGHPNIILMCLIFLLAGAFAAVAKGMGGVDSTVNLGLSLLPQNLLIVGVFVIGCFISLAMGTSMGTVVALAPIAIGISEQTNIPVALSLGAVIGGAMFGDNLSMISDTTIAAVRTQGTEMKEKFKMNFLMVLPAAILTAIILGMITVVNNGSLGGEHPYSLIKVIPYFAVIIVALMGVNVINVLAGGTIFAGIIGLMDGSFNLLGLLKLVASGMIGMEDIAIIGLIIGGMVELIKHNGGIDYLLHSITGKIKTKKGAEFAISGLVSAINVGLANNTISILTAGPLAKNIIDEYGIDPRRSASLLDIFSCCVQGILPYGGQLLVAAGLASISPVAIMPYVFYPILIGVIGIISILTGFPTGKKASKPVNLDTV